MFSKRTVRNTIYSNNEIVRNVFIILFIWSSNKQFYLRNTFRNIYLPMIAVPTRANAETTTDAIGN